MPVKLFNTLTKKKELIKPSRGKNISYYTCGPTVYQRAHIGNFRTYINEDLLKRTLLLNGYKVKQIMNITDVGHLEHDSDSGEDKIEKEARETKKSAWDIARVFENIFKEDLRKLNILFPEKFTRATEYIKEQIDLIKKLEKNGYTYRTSDGIYFDTSKFRQYGALVRSKLKGIESGARVGMRDKKNATDFALWKFSGDTKRQMEWPSPWGKGFPGWHLECSAMSIKFLGMPINIHAGGIDHIHPHHTNEIAQSEAAYGEKFVNIWMHSEFLLLDKTRIGKSEGNAISISDLENAGYSALDYRYMTFGAHYRSPLSFTWDSLAAAKVARLKLNEKILNLPKSNVRFFSKFKRDFLGALNDDLNIPKSLAVVWKAKGRDELLFADKILGLGLDKLKKPKIDATLNSLLLRRETYRNEKKWAEADAVRDEIHKKGYLIEDGPKGPRLKRIS